LYMNGFIDAFFVGDYCDFVDDVFAKHPASEKDGFIDDAIQALISFKCFKNKNKYVAPKKKPSKKEDMTAITRNFYSKDPLKNYPPIHGEQGLKGLSDFYDSEAVEIDKAMYRAMSDSKSYNMLFSFPRDRKGKDEEDPLLRHFELAWQLFVEKAAKDNLKRLKDYDKKHMIHYPIYDFLEAYFSLLSEESRRMWNPAYETRMSDIIEYILERFTLERGYRAYLKRRLEKNREIDDRPF